MSLFKDLFGESNEEPRRFGDDLDDQLHNPDEWYLKNLLNRQDGDKEE